MQKIRNNSHSLQNSKKKKKRNASSTTQKVIKTTDQKLLNRLITKNFTKCWRLEQRGKRLDKNLSERKHLNEKNKKLLQTTNETKTRRKGNNRRKEAATIKNQILSYQRRFGGQKKSSPAINQHIQSDTKSYKKMKLKK